MRRTRRQFEPRTYRFKSAEPAALYGQVWLRHIENLKHLHIQTHGVFTRAQETNTVVALVSYPESADIEKLTREYMASEAFLSTMDSFDKSQFEKVEEFTLHPFSFSDLH